MVPSGARSPAVGALFVDRSPDPFRRAGHPDVGHPEVADRVRPPRPPRAGVEAIVPASPTPLTPSGLDVAGVSVRSVTNFRHVRGRPAPGSRPIVPGDEVAVVVVHGLLVQGLGDALGQATVHLALDDQRVDDLADVVDRDVLCGCAACRSRCRPRSRTGGCRAGRRSSPGPSTASALIVGSMPSGRLWAANVASATSWIVVLASGEPLTENVPPLNSTSPSGRLEQVGGDLAGLLDHLVGGQVHGHAPDDQRARPRTCPCPGARTWCRRR